MYARALIVQGNLASTYYKLGQLEHALRIERDVYSVRLKLLGEEHPRTLLTANYYANSTKLLRRDITQQYYATMPCTRALKFFYAREFRQTPF